MTSPSLMRKMLRIMIDEERCINCNMCVKVCQKGTLQRIEGKEKPQVVRGDLCMLCLSCIFSCPTGAIRVLFSRS